MPYFDSIGEPAGYDYDVTATGEDYAMGMAGVMPPGMMGGGMPPETMGGGMGPLQAGDFPGAPPMGGGMPPEMMGGPPMGGGMPPEMMGGGMPPEMMGGPPMGDPGMPPSATMQPAPLGMTPHGPGPNDAKEVLRQRAEERLAASKRFQGAANQINGMRT